jgi:hypothetical protein
VLLCVRRPLPCNLTRFSDINIPISAIALVLLIFKLNLNPPSGDPAELQRTLDFTGLCVNLVSCQIVLP